MSFTNFLEGKLLEHLTGKTSYTIPTVYLGLRTADCGEDGASGTEPTATGSYARVATSGASWGTSTGGSITNAATLSFPASTAAWSTGATPLTHFTLHDAASAGNILARGALSVSRTVNATGVTLSFAASALTITLD